ncbi:phosphatase PAP2 family protein [Paracoccus sp. (in: a-proteobacteria)]|uniref:phosphatase PAP2 family protein n=1 Tax=Paracoccus sp. TaxID=267 RepID=UPI0026DFBC37|nr:phosphatase PAP2 family protein [Paracoccus sp. (in: a-proteobacteria)]MDO5646993.1 phosphatase PAP2 family protein [Paracoccus sp. (in: a-proteobacteria)]
MTLMSPEKPRKRACLWSWWRAQPVAQRGVLIASALLAMAVLLDAPVNQLARGMDASTLSALRLVTEIGDSFWSLLGSLILIALFWGASRFAGWRDRAVLRFAKSQALFVFTVVAVTGVTASLIKNTIGRARPYTLEPAQVMAFDLGAFNARWASFPSGHSTTALALAVALSLLWPRYRVAFLCLGAWGAASRMLIGVHWLSDVFAGAMLGAFGAVLIYRRMSARGIGFRRPQSRASFAPLRRKRLPPTAARIYAALSHATRRGVARIRHKDPA